MREAFDQELKQALVIKPILNNLDWSNPFIFYIYASYKALGSTLSQQDEDGNDHPIHFRMRHISNAKVNYTIIEKEDLAIIFYWKKFRNYLLG